MSHCEPYPMVRTNKITRRTCESCGASVREIYYSITWHGALTIKNGKLRALRKGTLCSQN